MKRHLLAATAIALALPAGSALAADMRMVVKAPPPPPPMWTSCYAGLNVGWAWGHNDDVTIIDHEGATLSKVGGSGPIGGGQIGCNYQFDARFVFGIEADIQGASIGPETTVIAKHIDWFGTVRGRVGFLVDPSLLVYATGGLAYGGVEASICGRACAWEDTLTGWTAGVGVEYRVAPNWSIKGEFLYFDLGDATFATNTPSGQSVTQVHYDGFIVRAGFNYHFDWGVGKGKGPVIARY